MLHSARLLYVHHILRFTGEEGADVVDADVHQTGARGAGGPGEVRGDDTIFRGEEGMIWSRRFDGEDVQTGTGDAIAVEGMGEGGFVYEAAAAGVEEEGEGFHPSEALRVDEILGFGSEGAVE